MSVVRQKWGDFLNKKIKIKLLRNDRYIRLAPALLFAVIFGTIAGYFLWHSIAASSPGPNIEVENMSLPSGTTIINYVNASGGKDVKFTQDGSSATGTVRFVNPVNNLTVRAMGSSCDGTSWPQVTIAVDGTTVMGPTTINYTAWRNYNAPVSFPGDGASHTVTATFTNGSSCGRYLYLDVIGFTGPNIEAENMNLPVGTTLVNYVNASGGQDVKFTQEGSIATGTVSFTSPVDTFTLRAMGVNCDSDWPKVTIAVDGNKIMDAQSITANVWTSYTKSGLALATGAHTITATYTNSSSTCGRYLYLDVAKFNSTRLSTPLDAKVSGVYWPDWNGTPSLRNIPTIDNLIYAAFAYGDGSQTGSIVWKPGDSNLTSDQFKSDMQYAQSRGQKVILSIGGSNDLGIHLTNATQVTQMVNSINQIVTDYGFDGIDWDLENNANITADSLVSATNQLKQKWGPNFIIGMAPAPSNTLYKQAAQQLGNNLDIFSMQFYDYAATDSERISGIVSRIKEMINTYQVPASKLGIGGKYYDPVHPTYVSAPSVYQQAYDQLKTTYPDLRGAYVWEAIIESNNNWQFANLVGKDVRSLP